MRASAPRPSTIAALFALTLAACGRDEARPPSSTSSAQPSGASVATATAAAVERSVTFEASDGAALHAFVGGAGDLGPRPLIVEFSPYGPACCGPDFGPDYNYVQVHARGTGLSTGTWSAVGPRDQQDVAEFLEWACHQPWSNGHIGLYGFSASAIAVYNSMHLPLSCVDAASLMAGSSDLYRDLLYPGGISNFVPATSVAFGVGLPILSNSPAAFQASQSPIDRLQSGLGIFALSADVLTHQTEDAYWIAPTLRPGPNTFPVLADTSFYDPEPRGPFEAFKLLRSRGVPVHLRTFGAHHGFPAGTAGPFPEYQRWFDRWVRGIDNGIDREPIVQLLVGNGSPEALIDGDFTRVDASDWPVPGTRWRRLYLGDGTLRVSSPSGHKVQAYPAITSLPTATDPHTTGTISAGGGKSLFDAIPLLRELALVEPLALTYTTPALADDVDVVGPASLDLFVATLTPEADLYAGLADVCPPGSPHAVAVGRLGTSFPNIIRERSLVDANGEIVHPYGDYAAKAFAIPGQTPEYHVEFWPIGNRFQTGHRLRLYLVGASGYMLPMPGVNLVAIGGATPSRLLLPTLPGSDLCAAIGAASDC